MTLSWIDWKQKYKKELYHDHGFEERFVDDILRNLDNVMPSDVIPQYHFIDDKNHNRYIDFVIINKAKGYFLPIELDGTQKDQTHDKWMDFLYRQNSMITQFGIVLRFTNTQMFNQPKYVIEKIQATLLAQSKNSDLSRHTQEQQKQLVAQYEIKLKELERIRSQNTHPEQSSAHKETLALITELQKSIAALQNNKQNERVVTDIPQSPKRYGFIALAGVVAIIVGVVLFSIKSELSSLQAKIDSDPQTTDSKAVNEPINTASASSKSLKNEALLPEAIEPQINAIDTTQNDVIPSNAIEPVNALNFIGSIQQVCGQLYELKSFSKGIYLSLDQPYMESNFVGVVWNSDLSKVFGNNTNLESYQGQHLCLEGKITKFNHNAQIIIKSKNQLKIN